MPTNSKRGTNRFSFPRIFGPPIVRLPHFRWGGLASTIRYPSDLRYYASRASIARMERMGRDPYWRKRWDAEYKAKQKQKRK